MKILLTGSYTLDFLYKELCISLPDHEITLDLYDNYFYQFYNSDSDLNKGKYDAIILYLDASDKKVNKNFSEDITVSKIRNKNTVYFISTPVEHLDFETYLYERKEFDSSILRVDYIIDINKLISYYGYENCYDRRSWYYGKILFNNATYKKIAHVYSSVVTSYLGKLKKVIVLDLDNTLWHGVLGDEGKEISESGMYSSFWVFQEKLKRYKEKGILLAICSKNNIDTVKEAFSKNDMPLKLEDFACIKCNWNDKATNIKEIAEELNLGLDSFIFMDDSEAEIEWVNKKLSQIECIQLPLDRFQSYPEILDGIDSIKNIKVTKEDVEKTEFYLKENKRKELEENSLTQEDFLKSLNIEYDIKINDTDNIARFAQLTQKTNQFNVTLKKYTEIELQEVISNGGKVYSISLKDKFGDYGIIGMASVLNNEITTFVISCRAFNKNVEYKLLEAIKQDFPNATLNFIKSEKNSVAEKFIEGLTK